MPSLYSRLVILGALLAFLDTGFGESPRRTIRGLAPTVPTTTATIGTLDFLLLESSTSEALSTRARLA